MENVKNKKIFIIAPDIGKTSGWGRLVSEILNQFKSKSVPFLVCSEKKGEPDGGAQPSLVLAHGPGSFLKNIFRIRKAVKECDIVHAFDGWPYAVYGYFAVLGTSKKLFVTGIGTYSVPSSASFWKSFLLKRAYMRSSQIMCISHYTAEQIRASVPKARVSVVHMGLTQLLPLSPEQIQRREEKYSLLGRSPILLTVGAIKSRKGQLDSVKACAALIEKYPKLLYCIVGDDGNTEYVKQIKEYVQLKNMEKNVRIISDAASDEDVSFFYQSCDMLLLPSRNSSSGNFEGFGLVLLEAGQFGKPGIGTRNCGVEDAIVDGATGFLVEQGQPEMIAAAVEKIFVGDKAAFSEKAKAFARSFSWSRTADAYLAAFSD